MFNGFPGIDANVDDPANHFGSTEILVVDDDPDAFMLLSMALEAAGGFRATVAESAKEALQAMYQAEEPFGGVFLDIQMPETTGVELCSMIRSIPGYDEVPIIMVTGMTDPHFVQDAYAAGATDFIAKPFDVEDVRARFSHAKEKQPDRVHCLDDIAARVSRSQETVSALQDAIILNGVERLVSRDAFHAYLLQSKSRLKIPIYVRAMKIEEVLRIFSEVPRGDFTEILMKVGKMVSGLTKDSGDTLTYFGNGIFVTCSTSRNSVNGSSLKCGLGGLGTQSDLSLLQQPLKLVVGREIILQPFSNSDVFDTLNQAIDAVVTE